MKFSAVFSVVAAAAVGTIVSAVPVPDGADYDLEVREEFLDNGVNDFWAREFDDEFDISARDIMDAVEDLLEARASRAIKFAWEGLGKDAARNKGLQLAKQALTPSRPRPSFPKPPAQQARPAARPSFPKMPAMPAIRKPATQARPVSSPPKAKPGVQVKHKNTRVTTVGGQQVRKKETRVSTRK